MKKEFLYPMYELFIDSEEVSTADLKKVGIYGKYLSDLLDCGTIQRVRRGFYQLNIIDGFFQYGSILKKQKEHNRAIQCFRRCYQIDPSNLQVCFQLFINKILTGQFQNSFPYFQPLYEAYHDEYPEDYNLYLLLFSRIIDLPSEYKERAFSIRNEICLEVDDVDNQRYPREKFLRYSIANQRYALAKKQLQELCSEQKGYSTFTLITKYLLERASLVQEKERATIFRYIQEENYLAAKDYLYQLSKHFYLDTCNGCYLTALKDLNKIMKYQYVPEVKSDTAKDVFEAVSNHNYSLALDFSNRFLEKYPERKTTNLLHILVSKVVEELAKNKEKGNVVTTIGEMAELPSSCLEEVEEFCEEDTYESPIYTVADFLGYLMSEDFEMASYVLHCYLEQIDQIQYEAFIIDLVNISLIKEDPAFVQPMTVLSLISKGTYQFDLSLYIQDFYEALSTNHLEEARLYLEILKKGSNFGQPCIFTEQLEQVLSTSEEVNYQEDAEEDFYQETVSLPSSSVNYPNDGVSKDTAEEAPFAKETYSDVVEESSLLSKNDDVYDDTEFIYKKYEQLKRDGIVLLKTMSPERINGIFDIVDGMEDVVAFTIGSGRKKRVVLRHKPFFEEWVDFQQLREEGKKAFFAHDYETCIQNYRKILAFQTPISYVYARLGLSYMKMNQKKLAIDYLEIATDLSKDEKINAFDFYSLIDHLRGLEVDKENSKYYVSMDISEFEEQDEYYGLEHVEEISDMITSGISLDDACQSFALNFEQQNLLYLVFAKSCYAQDNFALGDQYLKLVEKMKDKTPQIKKIFHEVQVNKKFYKYRGNEELSSLQLIKKY